MGNVKPLFDESLTYERAPNDAAIKALEAALEKARSGEIVGVSIQMLHHDGLAAYQTAGRCVSYSVLGAVSMTMAALQDGLRGTVE